MSIVKHIKQALILSLFLLILTPHLPAKERRGADVLIRKIDGMEIQGELIAVKKQALLVLSKEGLDVTTQIKEIDKVIVINKRHPWRGLGIGLAAGLVGGAIVGALFPGSAEPKDFYIFRMFPLIVGPIGLLAGLTINEILSIDKTYQIQGGSSYIVQVRLGQLKKRARMREVK